MRGASLIVVSALALACAIPRQVSAGPMTYLALGDSIAFGETDFSQNPSNGDRGYVSVYANALAQQNGGVRPNVVNLAVDGDTTSSFMSGSGRVAPAPGFTDASLLALNTNYGVGQTSQFTHLLSTVAQQLSMGNTISNVSLSLGSNDLFALAQSPGFGSMTSAQQQAALSQTLGTIQSNYTTLLTDLRALLPQANVQVVEAYNPFPAAQGSPFAALAAPAIQGLNQVLRGESLAFGAHYVDTYSAFAGHEAAYTYITAPPSGSNNVHPNAAGYGAIADQMQAVPEPTTLALFGAVTFALIAYRRRQSRMATA